MEYGNTQRGDPTVWPPPPTGYERPDQPVDNGLRPPTNGEAVAFLLPKYILHGIGFGTIYGTGAGVFLFIIGAIYGLFIGAFAGLILGVVDGAMASAYACLCYARGGNARSFGKNVCWFIPAVTFVGGILVAYRIFAMPPTVDNWFVLILCAIGAFASWHASKRILKTFAERFA